MSNVGKIYLSPRDEWVLEQPEFFTVVQYRPSPRKYFKFSNYKLALKHALKLWYDNGKFYMPLVYAVRETAQANLNHRKLLRG